MIVVIEVVIMVVYVVVTVWVVVIFLVCFPFVIAHKQVTSKIYFGWAQVNVRSVTSLLFLAWICPRSRPIAKE